MTVHHCMRCLVEGMGLPYELLPYMAAASTILYFSENIFRLSL
jgi:hypothetical protein